MPSRVVKPFPAGGACGSDVSPESELESLSGAVETVGSELESLGVDGGGSGTGTGLGLTGTVVVGTAGGGRGVVGTADGLGATAGLVGLPWGSVPTGVVGGAGGVVPVVVTEGDVSPVAFGSPEPQAVITVSSSAVGAQAMRQRHVVLEKVWTADGK